MKLRDGTHRRQLDRITREAGDDRRPDRLNKRGPAAIVRRQVCRACSRRQIVVFDGDALVPVTPTPAMRFTHAAGRNGLELDCAPLLELCPPPEAELDCDGEPLEFGSTLAMPTAARSTSNRPDATAATIAAMPDAGLPAVPAEMTAAPPATCPVTPSALVAVGMPPASLLPVMALLKAAFC